MSFWLTALAGLALLSLPFLKKLFPYLGDDCAYALRSLGLGFRLVGYKRTRPFYSILDCFLDAAGRHPAKTFLRFEGRDFSYGDVDRRSNRVARALRAEVGLREGDAVALFLPNEPSFVWTWLGLAKLGCPAALLNFNIRSRSLLHCFSCCGAKVIIAAPGKRRRAAERCGVLAFVRRFQCFHSVQLPGVQSLYLLEKNCTFAQF